MVKQLLFTYFIFLKHNPKKMSEYTGTVKFYNREKGFGFIKVDGSNEDLFVHQTGLIDDISENDQVEFDQEKGKGINAVNVKRV
jgi:CspA family cold shock protein